MRALRDAGPSVAKTEPSHNGERARDEPRAKKRRSGALAPPVTRSHAELKNSLTSLWTQLQRKDPEVERTEFITVRTEGVCETRDFRCVRSVLASASRPLRVMLYGVGDLHLKEARENVVVLHDTEPAHFELLLHFIFGMDVVLTADTASALFALADFLDVGDLREACTDYLQSSVDSEHLSKWFRIARETRNAQLQATCAEHLRNGLFRMRWTAGSFFDLEAEDLARALASNDLVCVKEEDVWIAAQAWARGREDEETQLERLAQHVRWRLLGKTRLEALAAEPSAQRAPNVNILRDALAAVERGDEDASGHGSEPRLYVLGELVVVKPNGARKACRMSGRGAPHRTRLGPLPLPVPAATPLPAMHAGTELPQALTLYTRRPCIIGRSRMATVKFHNPYVSSTHCKIWASTEQVRPAPARERGRAAVLTSPHSSSGARRGLTAGAAATTHRHVVQRHVPQRYRCGEGPHCHPQARRPHLRSPAGHEHPRRACGVPPSPA